MSKPSDHESSDLGKGPRSRSRLSPHAIERGKSFISSLFMAIRTAQIHDPSNRAFENAIKSIQSTGEALYAVTGGFSLQFVEESLFLNGIRLKFDKDVFTTVRKLQELLEARGLGGVEMRNPVTHEICSKLLHAFVGTTGTSQDIDRASLGLLGVQRLADGQSDYKIDRAVYAIQSYAKLILSVRSQLGKLDAEEEELAPTPFRLVRVIQDLVDLSSHRPDVLLRLAVNSNGAAPIELMSVGACLLVIAMGHSLALERGDLVDIAVATMMSSLGATSEDPVAVGSDDTRYLSLAALLDESGVSVSTSKRALVLEEHALVEGRHPYARLASVAIELARLVNGLSDLADEPVDALDALDIMRGEERCDPMLVDLAINVLRAFPDGTEVVLDSGEIAIVTSQIGGSRWDRPMVEVQSGRRRHLDLMLRKNENFIATIMGTSQFAESYGNATEPALPATTSYQPDDPPMLPLSAILEVPPMLSDSALFELPIELVEERNERMDEAEPPRSDDLVPLLEPDDSSGSNPVLEVLIETMPPQEHDALKEVAAALEKTRSDPRATSRRFVEVRVSGREELQSLWTANLSKGGVFIETSDPVPPGEQVEVRLQSPDGSLSIMAEVRHVLDQGTAQLVGLKPGMGLRFLDSPEKRRAIERYVEGSTHDLRDRHDTISSELRDAIRAIDDGVRANDLYRALSISPTDNEQTIFGRIGTLNSLFDRADPDVVAEARAQLRRIGSVLLKRGRRLDYDLRNGFLKLSTALEQRTVEETQEMRASWADAFPDRVLEARFATAEAALAASQGRFEDAVREAQQALANDPFNRELWDAIRMWREKAGS